MRQRLYEGEEEKEIMRKEKRESDVDKKGG